MYVSEHNKETMDTLRNVFSLPEALTHQQIIHMRDDLLEEQRKEEERVNGN